ncbi:ABC transporter substrate-binding protein [Bradyrhizobium sp.]|uniref:ABC transporter substrate-binding protein n=1 Tax=Bradyrhizobium sp. TaxID=376 RepID=UPI0039E40153
MKTMISLCLAGLLGITCAAAQDAKPVKIGVLEDMSGVYADITGPGSVAAAELAIADFGPTVLGRKIELLSADHQNKADVGSGVARRWIDVDNIDLITGIGNSSVALAVRNLTREAKKIDIVTSAGVNDLTGKACSPTGFHWVYNTYSLSKTVASASVRAGGDTLFFVAADYAFGAALARDGARFAEEAGGKVLGTVRAPLNSADFSSFILQAQTSKAKNITLALAGNDLVNFVRQASEFNVVQQGQSLSAMIMFVNDIHAIGLKVAQGLYLAETFYWDMNDDTRSFAKRFYEKRKAMPNGMQAGVYSAVKHYLTAVKAAGTTDSAAVAAKIREIPVNDFFSENVRVREDGRAMRNMHLFQVKKPDASKSDWDLLTRVDTLKDGAAFEPLSEGGCPLVAGAK